MRWRKKRRGGDKNQVSLHSQQVKKLKLELDPDQFLFWRAGKWKGAEVEIGGGKGEGNFRGPEGE